MLVDGIDASPAMVAQLKAQPGGNRVGVVQADLAHFTLARCDYTVRVCAVSTLFILTPAAQRGCIAAAAAHLRAGGRLFVEAFLPDPSRFDPAGDRIEHRPSDPGNVHIVRSHHDAARRRIHITHHLGRRSRARFLQRHPVLRHARAARRAGRRRRAHPVRTLARLDRHTGTGK